MRRPRPDAVRLDVAARGDDVLHDREAEAGASRRPCGVGAVEALEEPRQRRSRRPRSVVRGRQTASRPLARDRERELSRRDLRSGSRSRPGSRRRSGASAAAAAGRPPDRPRTPSRRPPRGGALELVRRPPRAPGSAFVWPSATISLPLSSSERNRISSISAPASRPRPGPARSARHVGAWEFGRVEQREDARERRAQLVRDRRGEAGAELVEAAVGARSVGSAARSPRRHLRSGEAKKRFTRSSPLRHPDRTGHHYGRSWPRS